MTQYIDHNAIVNSNMEKKGCQAGFKKDLHSFFFSKKYIFFAVQQHVLRVAPPARIVA